MKTVIVVDTNIIIQYLQTGQGVLTSAYEKYTMQISSATYTELLASSTFKDVSLEKEVLEFITKYFTVKDVTKAIAHQAAVLVREYELNLASAYIAASAMVEGVELLSDDKKTFGKIADLKLLNL